MSKNIPSQLPPGGVVQPTNVPAEQSVLSPRSTPTSPLSPPKPIENAVTQLQRLLNDLTEEERFRLAQAGVVVPDGDVQSILSGRHKWGLRCTKCANVALYFLGDRWTIDGEVYDEPPPLPHYRIGWTQNLPLAEIDRNTPRCQCCKDPLPLNPDDSFSRERRRIVLLSTFAASRDERFNRKAARETDRTAARVAGTQQLGDSTSFTMPTPKASEVLAQQHGPEIIPQLEALAQREGLTAAVATGKL